jgi:hypothetical protein
MFDESNTAYVEDAMEDKKTNSLTCCIGERAGVVEAVRNKNS